MLKKNINLIVNCEMPQETYTTTLTKIISTYVFIQLKKAIKTEVILGMPVK